MKGFILLSVAVLTLTACGIEDPVEQFMPAESGSDDGNNGTGTCGGQIIQNEYLVQWKDGSVEVINNPSRDKVKDILRPNVGSLKRVEYNQKFHVSEFTRSNVSTAPNQIDNWGFERVGAQNYWAQDIFGEGVVVAVVDTGVDVTHPLLANRIEINTGEIPNNNLDDDGNGYVDDVYGYNFVDNSAEMMDDVGHGTHVAGIIAIEHNEKQFTNNIALGMAPKSKILPVRFLGENGGTLDAAISALDYSMKNGAHIVNASWGGSGCSKILADKITELGDNSILFVTAAGNSGSNIDRFPEYPAAFTLPHQITVGSISPFNGMSSFSNYSSSLVHIFAPGYQIFSTLPEGQIGAQSGTSMATPFVAGAAALVKSQYPQFSPAQIKDAVLRSITLDNNYQNQTKGRLSL